AILWEPLWTGNVLGKEGVKIFLEESKSIPLKVYATASSGVPGAPADLLTPGEEFTIRDLEEMLEWEEVVGLGEVVEFQGVLNGDPEVHRKLEAARKSRKRIDGSACEMEGNDLNSYLAAGVQSDHEATTLEEAIERIRLGARLIIREGSGMRDMANLIGVITEVGLNSRHCCFCVDDKNIGEIEDEGLIDYMVKRAIDAGMDPVEAIQIGSLNAAEYMRVDQDIGSVAPGKKADILMLDDLDNFSISKVLVDGKVVAENGKLIVDMPGPDYPEGMRNSINLKRKLTPEDFVFRSDKEGRTEVRVIKVMEGKIISEKEVESLRVEKGAIQLDPGRDILKVTVVERYGKTAPNIGKGFVEGFGLKRGALAMSITPDVHHLIAIGREEENLSKAVNRLADIQGGIVLCEEGEIVDELSLSIGGIMSGSSYEGVITKLEELRPHVRDLGCKLSSPFMTLAFVGCPTLTSFKISDKGLVDVPNEEIIPYEVG
ncbi:hypothetical protein AKJ55_02030, partial [candidate division MSBL1 archaeon SCGC-AAA382M17]